MLHKPERFFTPDEKFRAALQFCLKQKGRGAMTRLAEYVGRDKTLIYQIKTGKRPGSEALKQQIALFFGYTYEEFLQLGAQLLAKEREIKEHFPGFLEVLNAPVKERFYLVEQLAAKHAGAEALLHYTEKTSNPPLLETEEDIVKAYQERLAFWKKKLEELKKLLKE